MGGYQPVIHFQHWYPLFGPVLETILHENCSDQFYYYTHSSGTRPPPVHPFKHDSSPHCTALPVVRCIRNNLDDSTKADFALGQLLPALFPTIITLVASTNGELGLLRLRRPILAFLVCCGTVATNPMRTFEYRNPVRIIENHANGVTLPEILLRGRRLLSLLEYCIALGLIANIGTLVYERELKSIFIGNAGSIFILTIWLTTSLLVHLLGWMTLYCRVRIEGNKPFGTFSRPTMNVFREEWTLSAYGLHAQLRFQKETYLFVGIVWFSSFFNICHIILGTVALGGLLFVDSRSAVWIFLRLLASTVVSRMLLMFELSGMRQTVQVMHIGETGHSDSGVSVAVKD